mmetsp:Transcript_29530/g.28707  ORF Transcript_29530/g.28707 Transcript_29530/m.28707 type:complete len:201 (+) Transcript_29530:47-649(+)
MQKLDIQIEDKNKIPTTFHAPDSDTPFAYSSLFDLGLMRIVSHCHYDPSSVNSGDYSVFQIELVAEELAKYYQGRFLLEVWNKDGVRVFQRVLKEECTQWKLANNVLVFKPSTASPLIYIMWLNDNKMIAYRHPFENNKEVDLVYFDGYLIVASNYNFKIVPISPHEVNANIDKFLQMDDSIAPTIDKEAFGIIAHDKIV